MSNPPSTPAAPRRFLLAKRGGAHSSQTPTTGPRQFRSTPRFGSSSVPRPTQGRAGLGVEDVEEVEEEDRIARSPGGGGGGGGGGFALDDSIEVESDAETAEDEDEEEEEEEEEGGDMSRGGLVLDDSIEMGSDAEISGSEEEEEEDMSGGGFGRGGVGRGGGDFDSIEPDSLGPFVSMHESSPLEGREPKRRRVSISPMPLSPPEDDDVGYVSGDDAHDITASSSRRCSSVESLGEPGTLHDQATTTTTAAPAQQPTFRAAPRFKPVEADTSTADGLPAAFSPQRRGAKYLPGGLAAGLQGWLSDVKGWEGVDRDAADVVVASVVVDEVRPGRRMYLVRGRAVVGTSSSWGRGDGRRFLLAGEGKLTGLGRRAVVGVGSVVDVGQPVWDVEMEGEVWTVSCDWSVS